MEHRTQMMGLVDRFLSGDWEAVRLHEGAAQTEEGGFFTPEDQKKLTELAEEALEDDEDDEEPTVEIMSRRWGSVNAMQDLAERLDEAEELAREDDLDRHEADSRVAQ